MITLFVRKSCLQIDRCQKTLIFDGLYEGMNIIGVTSLTELQKAMLQALEAVEEFINLTLVVVCHSETLPFLVSLVYLFLCGI
ncbi:hypothetical protein DP117_12355 [Brasilonema sp. UFV-L1]|nr:hypothetical protein [Brasilonema sp. UFV-L1]